MGIKNLINPAFPLVIVQLLDSVLKQHDQTQLTRLALRLVRLFYRRSLPDFVVLPFNPELELIVDPSLLENDALFFNAARLDRSMVLKTSDYVALAQPRLERIAVGHSSNPTRLNDKGRGKENLL